MDGTWFLMVFLVLTLGHFIDDTTGQVILYERNESAPVFPQDEIPANVTNIVLENVGLDTFHEDSFVRFYQLKDLNIGSNPFEEMPNLIPVGGTLDTLSMVFCQLTQLNVTVMDALNVLTHLHVRRCNRLVSLPPYMEGPQASLRLLHAGDTNLTEMPTLHLDRLYFLLLGGTNIREVTDESLANLPTLTKLEFSRTPLERLPDNQRILSKIERLHVPITKLTTIPRMCPRQNLGITMDDSPISMCDCENLWMKALDGQSGTVSATDMNCGSASTITDILELKCQRTERKREYKVKLKYMDFFCHFPVHSRFTGASTIDCSLKCIDTLGCGGFVHHGGTDMCVIIAPTEHALFDVQPDTDDGWNYYTMQEL